MRIGLVDCDLLDGGTNFPNLALMKISTFQKAQGNETALYGIAEGDDLQQYDELFVSKVFSKSQVPAELAAFKGAIHYGGTGFLYDVAPQLETEVEHSRPDYSLYTPYVEREWNKCQTVDAARRTNQRLGRYTSDSIGFTTRGCFRACPFCVNRTSRKSELWSPIEEFLDESRPFISLLDDNVFACKDWRRVFDRLRDVGKMFSFRQGLDLRLMNEDKARALESARYWNAVFFAFDNIQDADEIRTALATYRRFCNKETRCYLLVGYYEQGVEAVESFLDRLDILTKYDVLPYVMRYASVYHGELSSVWAGIAAWCNMPAAFRSWNFFELNSMRSKKATTDAEKHLPLEIQKRLAKRYLEKPI